jgi:hypothetical protein
VPRFLNRGSETYVEDRRRSAALQNHEAIRHIAGTFEERAPETKREYD